jgi:septum formation protein
MEQQRLVHETTLVRFRKLREEEISYYVAQFQPLDKAGAYGIQEWLGLVGIAEISGSYTNVVGLPTASLYELLRAMV